MILDLPLLRSSDLKLWCALLPSRRGFVDGLWLPCFCPVSQLIGSLARSMHATWRQACGRRPSITAVGRLIGRYFSRYSMRCVQGNLVVRDTAQPQSHLNSQG